MTISSSQVLPWLGNHFFMTFARLNSCPSRMLPSPPTVPLPADSLTMAHETAGVNMKLAQGLQLLEVLHPLFGMTRGGVIEPLMQVRGQSGRSSQGWCGD